ncbi:terminase small subunit protein [Tardiphaga sp. 367_B4_N1_1]|uniref:terminase small subunit-like protein n=1 Tax=Tardiphaga sp. 367_B4_N1_1 TaxID=3240777 RepID=UPI003F207F1E
MTQGRPSDFSAEIAKEICSKLAEGRTLRDVCRDDGMPSESTVRTWALDDREGFSAQYTRAREIGYMSMADELMEVADDGSNDWMERNDEDGQSTYVLNGEHVQRSRLRVDTRKWMLSKALPKVFGDKITQEHTGPNGDPIVFQTVYETKPGA